MLWIPESRKIHEFSVYLREFLGALGLLDRLVEDLTSRQRYAQRLERLQETGRALLRRLAHHVEGFLEADDVLLDVQVWVALQERNHARRHQRDELDVQEFELLAQVAHRVFDRLGAHLIRQLGLHRKRPLVEEIL